MVRVSRSWPFRRPGQRALAVSLALFGSGCLVEPPPEFNAPERSAPIVHTRLVVPPVNRPIVVEWRANGTAEVDFTIPFTTLNSSPLVVATLVTNLGSGLPREKVVDQKSERGSAGPDAELRSFSFRTTLLRNEIPSTCATLTALLFDAEDLDQDNFRLPTQEATDADRVAYVHWWLVAGANPDDVSFADCPIPAPSTAGE